MNQAEKDALREKHQQVGDLHPECRYCWTVNYPCDVIKVLDALDKVMPTDATSNTTTATPSQKSNETITKPPYIDIELHDWCYDCGTHLSACSASEYPNKGENKVSNTTIAEQLRHKEAELAYLKKQKAMVKFEVKALRRLIKQGEQA